MALLNNVAIISAAALIALFRILSSPNTLPVGSFYIVFLIFFTDIMWLILIRGGGIGYWCPIGLLNLHLEKTFLLIF